MSKQRIHPFLSKIPFLSNPSHFRKKYCDSILIIKLKKVNLPLGYPPLGEIKNKKLENLFLQSLCLKR